VSSDPTAGKVNEGLAAVGQSSGIHATFGRAVEESESAIARVSISIRINAPTTVVLSPSPDRNARKAWRKTQADQDSGISENNAELAAQ
jgi:hypothetical protein